MFVKPPLPRHTVHELDDGVQIILPSKKNVFRILWNGAWLLMWGYITGGVFYILGLIMIGFIGALTGWLDVSPSHTTDNPSFLLIPAIFLMLFLAILLGMGWPAIFAFLWQINGSEIIEIKKQTLVIINKIFRWKRPRIYEVSSVKDMRLNTQNLSSFPPLRAVQELLGHNGVVAFDYGAKTYRFGLDIDEAEAKQIISVLNQAPDPSDLKPMI